MIEMKTFKKFLSAVMAFCMLLGTFSVFSAFIVSAAEEDDETTTDPGPINAVDFFDTVFKSKEEKIASMDLKVDRFGYQLYCEPLTGEVAVVNTKTGDIISTNPYNVASLSGKNETAKRAMLSQLSISYKLVGEGGEATEWSSFEYAAELNQIKVKNVKNGIRVEYNFGKQEAMYLFPERIEKSRFEELILSKIPYDPDNFPTNPTYEEKQARVDYRKLTSLYTLIDPYEESLSPTMKEYYLKQYEILDHSEGKLGYGVDVDAIYVLADDATAKEKNTLEEIIKKYVPDYTYEQKNYDHELLKHVSTQKPPVQFRMALEYYLDETGLRVRMPANGIRYDQSSILLEKITCLPYMGAADSANDGYTVFPDGSGTLTRFEDVRESGQSFSFFAIPYGQDYAYHQMSVGKNLMPMRMPIFGLIEEDKIRVTDPETGKVSTEIRKNGYFAIIEEGDALATVRATHGSSFSPFNTVQYELAPTPKDTYALTSVISVGGSGGYTKTSDRRYTGNFTVRYIMLTDHEYAAKHGMDTTGLYDTSYMGMALAYRARLMESGALSTQTLEAGDIPLYIETLGAMDVQERFLSIPVTVTKALTTFEDVKTIHSELSKEGISNLVFKLTGYMNGGLKSTLANQVDVEKAVGGNKGLKKLQSYATEKNFEIYLDGDFSYTYKDELFDGFNRRKQAVRTIDDRFVQKQEYDAILQDFTSTGLIVISPAAFEGIFKSLSADAKKLGLKGLSLGALGSDLSSDFDEDDPYNREDSKALVVDVLKKVREAGYDVMIDGGNAYAVQYAKHILNIPLVSSRRAQASEAIPFFALVYHGYLNYAGSPTNMAGDIRYETLKMLENGANPYFLLVYRNSEKLKEDVVLSKYFAISYENWKEDLVDIYNDINAALSPVKNSPMSDHGFLSGMRVPTEAEKEADEKAKAEYEKEQQEKEETAEKEADRVENLKDHLGDSYIPEAGDVIIQTQPKPFDTQTKYIVDNGMIVKVTFENGYSYILNYNIFDVTVDQTGDTVIPKLGYVVLNAEGDVIINSGEEAAA